MSGFRIIWHSGMVFRLRFNYGSLHPDIRQCCCNLAFWNPDHLVPSLFYDLENLNTSGHQIPTVVSFSLCSLFLYLFPKLQHSSFSFSLFSIKIVWVHLQYSWPIEQTQGNLYSGGGYYITCAVGNQLENWLLVHWKIFLLLVNDQAHSWLTTAHAIPPPSPA